MLQEFTFKDLHEIVLFPKKTVSFCGCVLPNVALHARGQNYWEDSVFTSECQFSILLVVIMGWPGSSGHEKFCFSTTDCHHTFTCCFDLSSESNVTSLFRAFLGPKLAWCDQFQLHLPNCLPVYLILSAGMHMFCSSYSPFRNCKVSSFLFVCMGQSAITWMCFVNSFWLWFGVKRRVCQNCLSDSPSLCLWDFGSTNCSVQGGDMVL